MPNSTSKPMTIRPSIKTIEVFRNLFEESGANSQGEFLEKLCEKWITPVMSNILDANPVTTETQLQPDEKLLGLSQEETNEFLTLFQSSGVSTISEFLKSLFEKWVTPEKVIEPEPEPVLLQEPQLIQPQLQDNEILLSLTPAQLYALRETVLSKRFAESQNEIIDEKYKNEFYSGELRYTAEFKSLCIRNIVMTDEMPDEEKEAATCHNMAALLVNLFLFRLTQGYGYPSIKVKVKSLKSFIRELPEDSQSEFLVKTSENKLNEMQLSLTPAQLYALRENVLTEGFAENQNDIIDSLTPANEPFLYFGNLFEPEFQSLWVKNIVLTDEMPEEEKETTIRHNMVSFLINMFLTHLIEGKIPDTSVTAKTLITFIQEQNQDSPLKEIN